MLYRSLFLLMSVCAAIPLLAQSQATTGVISGRVLDQDEQPVEGAKVEMINTDTNFVKTAITDEAGRFRGLLLPLGPYRVRASKEGYLISTQEGFRVSVGKSLNTQLTLKKVEDPAVLDLFAQLDSLAEEQEEERQEILETVTVSAAEYDTVVEVGKVESSTHISEEAVEGLPNDGRNFLDFVTMTPGATIVQGPDGEELSINGQKGVNNNIAVDGTDFNNPFFGEQRGGQRPAFTFNIDAVEEVVVVSDGASAEFGRSSGGFINVITKSGTNEFKGSVHTFFKDDSLNERRENADGSLAPKADFSQFQTGFTAGGPFVKDKVFYFVSFDYQDGEEVKQNDPSRIEPQVVDFFDSIGIPGENLPITRTNDAHAFLFKLDASLNESHLLTMRLTDTFSEQENGTFDVDSWGRSANAVERAETRGISFALNSVLTMNTMNELRVQYSVEERPRPYNGPTIAGTDRPLPDTAFDFESGYRFGMPFFIPVEYEDSRLQINNNLSIISGSHLIKVGAEINYTEADQTFVGFGNGRWIFNSTEGFLNYASNSNYIECSDGSSNFDGVCPEGTTPVGPVLLYLQQAGVGGLTVEEAGSQVIDTLETALFIQDKWDVTPTFTLQYGLRWEAQYMPDVITPADEVFFADFIGETRQGQEFPSDGTIKDVTDMWQPRLGMTWDPEGEGKSVVRLSAGIYYARTPGLPLASIRSTNGSRGQTLFRSSNTPFLGPTPAYPDLIPTDDLGEPQFPDVFVMSKDFRNPRTDTISASYEREIMPGFSASAKFTYAKGRYQARFINRNDPALGSPWSSGLGADGTNGINTLTVMESIGESLYRAWTFTFNKTWSDNFLMQGNYTYAKDKSHDDNERDPFSFRYADVTRLDADWGYSDRDQRHRASAWMIWDPWENTSVNLRYTYRSPQPRSVTADGEPVNSPADRVNPDGTITPRNNARKDNRYSSLDLRLSQKFQLGRYELEVIAEGFNLFNSRNQLTPSTTNLIFNFDGTVQSGAGNPRQIQLGLKGRW